MLLPLLFALHAITLPAVAAPGDSSSLMGPGISRRLADVRAAAIRDVRYDLRLDVTARDSAVGHVTIRFRRAVDSDVILDWRGRPPREPRANGRPIAGIEANGAHLRIPAAALARGENVLDFDFVAPIAPAGTSVIRFHDTTDGADYLYTLLVPADASALFPCFDQPDLKARVTLTLTTPASWTAVANGPLVHADTILPAAPGSAATVARGSITHRFRQTEPVSTYLIAFAAGPWATVRGGDARHPITMYVRRSRAREVDADTLLALNARALDWLGRWFDRPFPFAKFDFVLAPAFPFGGMEHPGAVFYNEQSFIWRERPTTTQVLGREATIYHEVAHQWFGDLVTMRWFDDLWLKEGFASYMAARMQAELDPRADAWKTFYLRDRPPAYAVDASAGTTPVWQALANLDQAKSAYGPIVYDKAPGILKQLSYLVGEDALRRGLQRYLARHAYANATWRDLLDAIGAAGGRSLTHWGEQYILRPGMPIFEQHVDVRDGRLARLVIAQHPAQPLSGSTPWPAKLEVLLWYENAPPVRIPVELRGDSLVVPVAGRPAPAFVFVNAGDHGYGLVRLDPRSVAWLERHIGTVGDPLLRAMLWGALWDRVRDARLAPSRWLELALRQLPSEPDEQIAAFVLARLVRATTAYLGDVDREAMLPRIERTLLDGVGDARRPYGIRKSQLDALIAVAGTAPTLDTLDALLDRDSVAGAPLRPPTRWAIVTSLVANGAPGADRRLVAESRRDSTTEGRRLAFVAGAARPTTATKLAYWNRWFADTALNEDWVTASLRAFDQPTQDTLTLRFLVPALDRLGWIQRNRRIFFLGAWLGAFLDGQRTPAALVAVDRWLDAHPALPRDLREKVLQARDELWRTVRIRQVFGRGGESVES